MKARARGHRPGEARQFDVDGALRAIARPRLFGSAGAGKVARTIRSRFKSLGYEVREEPFSFNPLPGRFGVSAAGALYTTTYFFAAFFLYTNHAYSAIALLLILLLLVAGAAMFAAPMIDRIRWGERQGVNLYAAVHGRRPMFVVMAHRDSKSQPVPLSLRGPAIAVAISAYLALLSAAALHTARPLPATIIALLGALGVLAGIVLIFCWVDNRSPGALDNASGVVAALSVAALERDAGDVAFLITDAEELGLAGSRAAARRMAPVIGVINLDGLDDEGPFYVLEQFGLLRKKGIAPHLAAALLEEAAARGEAADRRPVPYGIPLDHMAMVNAGIPALTVMRGTLHSLRRVHLPTDDLLHLQGDGIRRAVQLVSGALQRLREQTHTRDYWRH